MARHRAGHGHIGAMVRGGVDTHPDLDQLELEAIEGSVGHGLGQFDAAQEGGGIECLRVQLQP